MPATVLIREKNGVGETATDKTSGTIRFKTADDATVDANNRITIPGAGSAWSYQKWLRLNVSVAPDTDLQNLEFYTDGTLFATGVTLWAKAEVSYATPALETASTGYTDASTYTSGSALSLGAGPHTGTGDKGSYLRLALEVASTASPGTLTAETLTFAYDET